MTLDTRKFEVLRISILSHCNFACVYCAPKEKENFSPQLTHSHSLSPDQLDKNLNLLKPHLKIKEVHLTGGEPTLHKNLIELIQIVKYHSIQEIALTSNGHFNPDLLEEMVSSGLTRINFSLDSITQSIFERLSDRKIPVSHVLNQIKKAKQIGLKVKINTTVLRGLNDHEVLNILTWCGEEGIPIRFLEFMKMGPLQKEHPSYFYSAEEIRNQIRLKYHFQDYPTPQDSTAQYYITNEGYIFGMIANHTEPFCEGCNRLRMDSKGRIYGCLSDETSFVIPESFDEIQSTLHQAMLTKKNKFTGSELSMKYIGG
ncbi:molybdenum cofactor biosynthesis protein A [Leptospira yanagawae serovar Saopaulo str. Sao Paulo = ATCC 700523]|uniref:Molybdenum cofactor biosynthesis protein A n=1 Tax=Leptospira yanagawae serovar Saopaulo str. Sao Paulo = ATCC 700523 TaxID=1249483 RepID=A0A5E8HD60_9LEPT|nr:GTP 3',8-cyclase MoaA [Leptospira yanagawae]EOQ88658.1 molybdenum cofactor biosynthesis protein A [Leptospira yanagawae serovar Saopaulo str. Sao Paulo = ATCC 700523]